MEEKWMKDENSAALNRSALFLIIGILLIAANLRAPLTSVGALIPTIRDSLGVSNAAVGIITTLPLLAFATISPFAPKAAARFGIERTIFLSMLLLLAGIATRSGTGVAPLFIGTVLIGIAISFGNVLLPGYIKLSFPLKVGIITACYTVVMNLCGALAAGVSVPLSGTFGIGWQGALAAWSILVFIAILIWLPQLRKGNNTIQEETERDEQPVIWKSAVAWQVTLFMGLQSLMFYTPVTWLPNIVQSNGYSSAEAGWLLSLMQVSVVATTFVIPIVADKMKNQKILGVLTGSLFVLSILGLLSGQQVLIILSVIVLGAACGSGFSLSMMLFTLQTKNGYEASKLSGMAQSVGYLLAASGPVLFGALADMTGSRTLPLSMLLLVSFILIITGYLSGRKIIIDE